MTKKKKFVPHEMETQEQKEARWNKYQKMAKSFAKSAGLYDKVKAERKLVGKFNKTPKNY